MKTAALVKVTKTEKQKTSLKVEKVQIKNPNQRRNLRQVDLQNRDSQWYLLFSNKLTLNISTEMEDLIQQLMDKIWVLEYENSRLQSENSYFRLLENQSLNELLRKRSIPNNSNEFNILFTEEVPNWTKSGDWSSFCHFF